LYVIMRSIHNFYDGENLVERRYSFYTIYIFW
jgi:hypothetical protein